MNTLNEMTVLAQHGRDIGKTFHLQEIPPRELAGYVLRLVAALRVQSYEALLSAIKGEGEYAEVAPIDSIMGVLQGADPAAIHGLMNELLDKFVKVAPDPQHPGAVRTLMDDDIRELRTLGQVLAALARMHFEI